MTMGLEIGGSWGLVSIDKPCRSLRFLLASCADPRYLLPPDLPTSFLPPGQRTATIVAKQHAAAASQSGVRLDRRIDRAVVVQCTVGRPPGKAIGQRLLSTPGWADRAWLPVGPSIPAGGLARPRRRRKSRRPAAAERRGHGAARHKLLPLGPHAVSSDYRRPAAEDDRRASATTRSRTHKCRWPCSAACPCNPLRRQLSNASGGRSAWA